MIVGHQVMIIYLFKTMKDTYLGDKLWWITEKKLYVNHQLIGDIAYFENRTVTLKNGDIYTGFKNPTQ